MTGDFLLDLLIYVATTAAGVSVFFQILKKKTELIDKLPSWLKMLAVYGLGMAAVWVTGKTGIQISSDWSFTQEGAVAFLTWGVSTAYHAIKKAVTS